MINQARLQKSQPYNNNIQFGIEVPRNHNHAMSIDLKNGNKLWYQAEQAELKQIFEYNTFVDKGKRYVMPNDFTKIRVHFIYAAKHDGRRKAR